MTTKIDHRAVPVLPSGEMDSDNELRHRAEVERAFGVVDIILGQLQTMAIKAGKAGEGVYVPLAGGEMTGDLEAPNITAKTFMYSNEFKGDNGSSGDPTFTFKEFDTTGLYTDDGEAVHFTLDGTYAGSVEAAGASTVNSYTIMTREKGDARYGELATANTWATYNTFQDLVTVSRATASEQFRLGPISGATTVSTYMSFYRGSNGRKGYIQSNNGGYFVINSDVGSSITLRAASVDLNKTLNVTGNIDVTGSIYAGGVLELNEVRADNGSVTDPSFTFKSDETIGMMLTSSLLHVVSGGQWMARFDPGTSSPDAHTVITREKGDGRYLQKTAAYGSVGSYVFGHIFGGGIYSGENIAGSTIEPAGNRAPIGQLADNTSAGGTSSQYSKGGGTLTGTWSARGEVTQTDGTNYNRATSFQRVS